MRTGRLRRTAAAIGGMLVFALALSACGTPAQPTQPVAQAAAPTTAPKPSSAPRLSPPPARTAGPAATAAAPKVNDRLYVRTGQGDHVIVFDTADKAPRRELPSVAPAGDWSVVYAVIYGGGKTTVRAIDAATGRTLRELKLSGNYALPAIGMDGTPGGLAPNGRWLALTAVPGAADRRGSDGMLVRSRFLVLSTAFDGTPKPIEIEGDFWFDALSNDGSSLYLIENLAYTREGRYQVRAYNVQAGTLDPQVIVAKGATQIMQGVRQMAIASPTGEWLYSLYLRNANGPFIHALNLQSRFAVCIELPKQDTGDWEKQLFWAMAMAPEGNAVYVANGALGVVAEMDPSEFRVKRTAMLPAALATKTPLAALAGLLLPAAEAKGIPAGGAVLSPDGATLWTVAPKGLVAINTRDLSVRGRYLQETAFQSIALSADGSRLYATSPQWGMIMLLDARTGVKLEDINSVGNPWTILRVEAVK